MGAADDVTTAGRARAADLSGRDDAASPPPAPIRIAAAGDIHACEEERARIAAAFGLLRDAADLVLLAGDLTTHGEPEQARILADACRAVEIPIVAVLGNHDCHAGRREEVIAVLESGGVTVLERSHMIVGTAVGDVAVVGTKGFIGGFSGSHLPDFGESLLRECYAQTTADVEALDAGLRAVALCPLRIVLLHYAPTAETLRGEPPGIWTMLGSDRLAGPINEHEPDLVLHGHAHAGQLRGTIGTIPVYNVATQVMARDFWVFELTVDRRGATLH